MQLNEKTDSNITALQARTHFGEILDHVRYRKTPCLIERHGHPIAVLLDIETYSRLQLPALYQKWTEEAVQKICDGYSPLKIILFGSTATGHIKEDSDIDLLIIKNTSERIPERIDSVLKLLPENCPVEPHVFTPTEIKKRGDDLFLQEALKGRILYEAS